MKPWEMDWGEKSSSGEKKPWEMNYSSQEKPAMEHTQYVRVPPVQETGSALDFLKGIGSGFADLGRGAQQRWYEANRATGAATDADVQKLYSEEAARRERRKFDPEVTIAEKVGRGTGIVGGTLPLAFTPQGKTAIGSTLLSLLSGGVGGGLLPATSGDEALVNIGAGAGGQAAGNIASRAFLPTIARNMTQAQRDVLDIAGTEGIPLRTGEATGSRYLRNWEATRSNRPITGPMEERFNEAQTRAINKAFTRRLGPDAQGVSRETGELSDKLLLKYRDDIGDEVSGMVKGKDVHLQDFFKAIVDVNNQSMVGGKLTSSAAIRAKIDDALDLIVNKPSVKGEVAQDIRSRLLDQARDARSSDAAGKTELANLLEDLADGLKKSMQGTLSASEQARWAQVNRQYANYKLIEEAFQRDVKSLALGDVPINKLARVMESTRPNSYVHGTGDFSGLAKLGQVVHPPSVNALLAAQGTVGLKNAGDVVAGMTYPILESKLVQGYLTGGLPFQRFIRDTPGASTVNDALMRAAGMTLFTDKENYR